MTPALPLTETGDAEPKKNSPALIANDPSKASIKTSTHPHYLDVPPQIASRRSSDTASDISISSADDENERRAGRLLDVSVGSRLPSRSPAPTRTTLKQKVRGFWSTDKGLLLVILAQFFGVMMSVTTRLLEMDGIHGPGMHPFQILFARMTGTLVLSGAYQWLANVEHAPFGPREVRNLLISRGIGGFFGVYGMYYSLQYLPLSDATVITFLAPIVACWACSILIHEPFTRSAQIAGIISFFGVVLIARPSSFLSTEHANSQTGGSGAADALPSTNSTKSPSSDPQGINNATSTQRLSAVGVALIGVLGAACAYTTIRWIGQRAHPLISVNYFAFCSTIISIVALLSLPGIGFRLPASLRQWIYLLFLGVCGFIMQFLLTAGLAYEKSSRATNMVYTQMLFALAFDKLVWDTTPGWMSLVGGSLILGSALYVAVLDGKGKGKGEMGRGDEEAALVEVDEGEGGVEAGRDREQLRGVQEVQLRTLRV